VDSGTTDSFFTSSAKSSFMKVFKVISGNSYNDHTEFSMDASDLNKYPDIHLVLQGEAKKETTILTIPPSQYFTKSKDGKYIGNFHFTESNGGGKELFSKDIYLSIYSSIQYSLLVLGASTMLNFNVIFDMEGNRVGFAPADCEKIGSGSLQYVAFCISHIYLTLFAYRYQLKSSTHN